MRSSLRKRSTGEDIPYPHHVVQIPEEPDYRKRYDADPPLQYGGNELKEKNVKYY